MNKAEIALLFDYNYWANARVMAAAAKLAPEQFLGAAGLTHGTVRGALVHVMAGEIVWRLRCQEGTFPKAMLTQTEFPTYGSLMARWQEEERAMRAYLDSLSEEGLNGLVKFQTTRGHPLENILWQLLANVVNHGTQSRSEAAVALTNFGCSPGDLDMLSLFRERAGHPRPERY